MSDQHTKVTYDAVANFTDLDNGLDRILAKLEAIKKAERDINRSRRPDVNKGGGTGSQTTGKSAEANELRRIKRNDQALAKQIRTETRHQKSLDAALDRRIKKAQQLLKAQDLQNKKDAADQRKLENAQKRRDLKSGARASVDSQTIKREAKIKGDAELAQAKRTERVKDQAQSERLQRERHESDLVRKAEKAQLAEDIRDEALANARERMADLNAARLEERIKDDAAKERARQQRIASRDQESKDKQRAIDLARQVAVARDELDRANRDAQSGNRFSRNKVRQKSVGQVQVSYDEDKDVNYFQAVNRAREQELNLIQRATRDIDREVQSRGLLYNVLRKIPEASRSASTSTSSMFKTTQRDIRQTNGLLGNFMRNLDAIGRWRPRLLPPFIALIPIVAALLGLINPLVAGLGAIGVAAVGLAGNLASLTGAALGAIPALASLLSVGAALKMTFGGVGKALKAAGTSAKGSGAGSNPTAEAEKEELSYLEQIQRAQEKYRRSIEDVADATNDLEEAKKDYFERLKDVEKQVNRVRMSEARAQANVQLAVEDYYNVMADPGSTKGQKMDAAVGIDEAKQDLTDLKQELSDLRNELSTLQSTGVNGDKAVRDASRRLTDAIWAQRDAQIDLANAYKNTGKAAGEAAGSGGNGGVDAFAEAMAKLSPSAQAVVLALLAMKPAWEGVQRTVQEAFFSEIVNDIDRLVRLFPTLENLLSKTAGALGRVSSRGLQLITSNKWIEDLNILAEQNVPLVENVGDGLLEILDMLLDLSVAAGPFATAMSEGFKEGAENLGDIVANARETGSLAEWLETVRQRLAQWWRIIKNIGSTLFNYTSAAGEFGQWLTDGFEKLTEGWKEASEEAKKEDSPFKVFLEDVKPALTEVKDLFATFFSWFGREASDPENIKSFTELVDTITNDLGPALARIFDSVSKSGVQQTLVDSIVTIVESIATLLENGGAEGIKSFFDTIAAVFETVAGWADNADPEFVEGLTSTLLTLSALRFLGLTKLLDKLVLLGPLWGTITKAFKAMKGAKVPALDPSNPTGTTTPKDRYTGKHVAPPVVGNFKGKFLPMLGKAGLVGLVAATAVDAGFKVADMFSVLNDPNTTSREKAGGLFQSGQGAQFGLGPGVGWAVKALDNVFPGLEQKWNDWLTSLGTGLFDWISGLPAQIENLGIDIWMNLVSFSGWLAEKWTDAQTWFNDLPNKIFEAIGFGNGVIWENLVTFKDWLVSTWEDAAEWFANLPQAIFDLSIVIWDKLTTLNAWLQEKWEDAKTWLIDLPNKVKLAVQDLWAQLPTFGAWLRIKWIEAVLWFARLSTRIGIAAKNMWEQLPSIGKWLDEQNTKVRDWVLGLPGQIGSWFSDALNSHNEGFERGRNAARGGASGGGGGGGRGAFGMSAMGDINLPEIAPKKDQKDSIWSNFFGNPITWLTDKFSGIPQWFEDQRVSIVTPIQETTSVVSSLWALATTSIITSFVAAQKGVTLAITGIKTTISNVWANGIKPVLDTLGRIVRTGPPKAFADAAVGIGQAWSKIIELAKVPVRFVVDVVIGGLVDAVNQIPGVKVKKPSLPRGFHDGGYTGNKPWRQAVGEVHGDEHVIRAGSRRKIERSNPGLLDHMNTYGEVPGYRNGGLVNPLPPGSYSVTQPYKGAAHNGIDLGAPMGTRVYAAGAGTVQLANPVNMGGNEVYIQHDNGLGTRYSHLSRFAARVGQRVRPGNIIGYVGSTGMSTGPHLHYMVHAPGGGPGNYGNHQNPAGWMNGNAVDLGEAWNPLTGLTDFVSSKLEEKFPGGGMWVDVAGGIAKSAVKQVITAYTPKIGVDSGHTLFDRGGWWNGDQLPVSKLSQPEAILTAPQWDSMHRISNLMTDAFSGINRPSVSRNYSSGFGVPSSVVAGGGNTDNSITIERLEINNPVGETTSESVANTIRDVTYMRGV